MDKGDLVAIYLESDQILDWIVAYSAVHKLGAIAVPMNNRLSAPEVRAILEHAEVTAVVASSAYEEAVAPLLDSLASLTVAVSVGAPTAGRVHRPRGGQERRRRRHPGAGRRRRPGRRHVHVGHHRAGPKGVAVRHGQVAMLPNGRPDWQGTGWFTASPVFTFAGLGFIYNPMKAGMTVLYLPRFDAGRWLEIVEPSDR